MVDVAEASFLYREGRIEKFAVLDMEEAEKKEIAELLESMQVRADDCLLFYTKTQ